MAKFDTLSSDIDVVGSLAPTKPPIAMLRAARLLVQAMERQ